MDGSVSTLAPLFAAAFATAAQAEPWVIVAVNSTGQTIKVFQTAPSPGTVWAAATSDSGSSTVVNGARTTLRFDKPSGTCRMDLRVTFSDGTKAVYSTINVCDNSYLTLHWSNGKATYTTT